MKHGDFSRLAEDYAKYRPSYSRSVRGAIVGLLGGDPSGLDAIDVGAGTGIWTRMLSEAGFRSVIAVEPNEAMRAQGVRDNRKATRDATIDWRAGSGEETGLAPSSADLLTMASSLHWVDFDLAMREFHRVLRPGGRFVALWNPRVVEATPLPAEIEAHLQLIAPDLDRKSSGRSGLVDRLPDLLSENPYFEDVVYVEGRHTQVFTPEEYLGVWRSVNDVQVQLGPQRFAAFLGYVAERVSRVASIEAVYMTRAWASRRRPSPRGSTAS